MILWSLFAKFSKNLIAPAIGGFEVPQDWKSTSPFQPPPNSPGMMPVDPNLFVLPGWKTVGAQKPAVYWIQDKSMMLGAQLTTPNPQLFVDLTSWHTQPTPIPGVSDHYFGGVELADPIATEAGKRYEVSFLLGTREDHAGMCGPVAVSVFWGPTPSERQSFATKRQKGAQMTWTRISHVFTARSNSTRVTIYGLRYGKERLAAGVDDDAELIALDDVGLRELTILGRVLNFFTRALRFIGLVKTPLRLDPNRPRP
jgi:hypothetical protein